MILTVSKIIKLIMYKTLSRTASRVFDASSRKAALANKSCLLVTKNLSKNMQELDIHTITFGTTITLGITITSGTAITLNITITLGITITLDITIKL